METSTGDTATEMVLPPPVDSRASYKRLYWAMPLLTVSFLIFALIAGSGSLMINRWETAPGQAEPVADRLTIEDATRYPATNKVMFVSAYGSQLTALESFIGWLDPDVNVMSRVERFGPVDPSDQRRIGFQDMASAKQIAEYVALGFLGYKVSITEGEILISDVVCEDTPKADSACKVLEVGEVITSVDGEATATLTALSAALSGHKPGDVVTLGVIPFGKTDPIKRSVRLIASNDDPTRGIIGILPGDTRKVVVPLTVNISTAEIGGPSAGLAFTLALIDELTPGELFGTTKVAVTGTISDDGSVGAIGALRQKAVAVKRAGGKVFIVPSGQSEEEIADAQEAVGSGLRIIQVATLKEALDALLDLGGDPINKVNATT